MEALLDRFIAFFLGYVGFWLFLSALEYHFAKNKSKAFSDQMRVDAGLAVIGLLIAPILLTVNSGILILMTDAGVPYQPLAHYIFQLPLVLQCVIAMFLFDAVQYIRHRIGHRYLWSCHAIHHSATDLHWSAHYRRHPFDVVFDHIFVTIALYLLGFSNDANIFAQVLMGLNNMWVHVKIDIDYGRPFRAIFASPNYHKWHHANEQVGIDKNFADLFVILDIIGKTYYNPRDTLPKAYGIHGLAPDDPVHTSISGALLHPIREIHRFIKQHGWK